MDALCVGPLAIRQPRHVDIANFLVTAIAERDDWAPFEAKIAAVRRLGEATTADAPA